MIQNSFKQFINGVFVTFTFLFANCFNSFGQWNHIYTFNAQNIFLSPENADIHFINDSLGFAFVNEFISPSSGNRYSLFRTTDYGDTWNIIHQSTGYGNRVSKIQSLTADTLITVVRAISYYSKISLDNGNSWNDHLGLIGLYELRDVLFIHSNKVLATGVNNLIKNENGVTTTLIDSDSITFFPGKINMINNYGYILAQDSLSNSIVLHSNNSGDNWETKFTTSSYEFKNLYFTSESVGYIVCNSGYLLKTENYGQTWTEIATNVTTDLNKIQFINDTTFVIVGNNGVFLYSEDAGNHFTQITMPVTSHLLNVNMLNNETGYVISSDFKLLRKSLINQQIFDYITYYPNPCHNLLYFPKIKDLESYRYYLYDEKGTLVLDGRLTQDGYINIEKINAGVYYLRTLTSGEIITNKIVKY